MTVLGLSYDFHDASASIVDDTGLVAAAAEERFSLQKHDASFPRFASEACLSIAGTEAALLDGIAFYERPHEKFTRVLDDLFSAYPRGSSRFGKSMKNWLGDKLWQRDAIARGLGVKASRIEFFPHHECHAAQAFCPSPFEEAAILVVDGVGEWGSTTLAFGKRADARFHMLEEYEYPQSIGLVYAAFTAFLGFKPNSGESSVMALAGFGTPKYVELVRKVMWCEPDCTYRVDARHFDFLAPDARVFRESFCKIFGEPRSIHKKFPFDALADEQRNIDAEDQYGADIAASLQAVLTEVLLGLCTRLRRYSNSGNLCFSGGVALNCLANTELIKASGFEKIFIPPDPGDGGAAIGAACLASGSLNRGQSSGPYLGTDPELAHLQGLLEPGYLMHLIAETGLPADQWPSRITIAEYHDDSLLAETARDLRDGRIVGWVQGRFEVGPRALGNRSLLVDPSNLQAVRRMSRGVKSHVSFRPYALSIAAEAASNIIDCSHLDQPVMKWMQTIWPVRDAMRDRVRGGVHVDGTTRPQLCGEHDNPLYWRLLGEFGRHSGQPVLLNTSFNERSQPMIGHATSALASFLRTAIDTLVLGNTVIRKHLS